ncbi:unnamed protein product [Chrysoparadoxa australica]
MAMEEVSLDMDVIAATGPSMNRRVPSFKLAEENSPSKKSRHRIPSFRAHPGQCLDDITIQQGKRDRQASFSLGDFEFFGQAPMADGAATALGHASGKGVGFALDDAFIMPSSSLSKRIPSFKNALDLCDLDFMAQDINAEPNELGLHLDSGKKLSFLQDWSGTGKRVGSFKDFPMDGAGFDAAPDAGHKRLPSFSFMVDEVVEDGEDDSVEGEAHSEEDGVTADPIQNKWSGWGPSALELDLVSNPAVPPSMAAAPPRSRRIADSTDLIGVGVAMPRRGPNTNKPKSKARGGMLHAAPSVHQSFPSKPLIHTVTQSNLANPRPKRGSNEGYAKRQTSEEVAKRLPVSTLERHYHTPLNVAAKELNVSLTMLKKLCRQYGVKRWPHRQVTSLDKSIRRLQSKLDAAMADKGSRNISTEALEEKLEQVQMKRMLIVKTASAGLEPTVLNAIFATRPGELDEAALLRSGDFSKLGALLREIKDKNAKEAQQPDKGASGKGKAKHGGDYAEEDYDDDSACEADCDYEEEGSPAVAARGASGGASQADKVKGQLEAGIRKMAVCSSDGNSFRKQDGSTLREWSFSSAMGESAFSGPMNGSVYADSPAKANAATIDQNSQTFTFELPSAAASMRLQAEAPSSHEISSPAGPASLSPTLEATSQFFSSKLSLDPSDTPTGSTTLAPLPAMQPLPSQQQGLRHSSNENGSCNDPLTCQEAADSYGRGSSSGQGGRQIGLVNYLMNHAGNRAGAAAGSASSKLVGGQGVGPM